MTSGDRHESFIDASPFSHWMSGDISFKCRYVVPVWFLFTLFLGEDLFILTIMSFSDAVVKFYWRNRKTLVAVFRALNTWGINIMTQHLRNLLGCGFKYVLFYMYSWPNMFQFDEHIFQMGWFNHQLENDKLFIDFPLIGVIVTPVTHL